MAIHLDNKINHFYQDISDNQESMSQSITSISNTHSKDFEMVQKNFLVINDNIKNIGSGNQVIEDKVVSIEEKLASTTVEQKLDQLEKTIKNLQLLKSDTPMDTMSDIGITSVLFCANTAHQR